MSMTSSRASDQSTLLLCLASFGIGLSGCTSESPEEPAPRPDVVMIVVDTLRADRLAFYGCDRENAPFLSSLAAKGLVFEQSQAPGPWTVPSTASLMTSTYPFQHGVVDGFDWNASDEENVGETVNRIPASVETLPEMMQGFGYKTYGVSANVLVGFEMGFDRGFDHFSALDDEIAETVNTTLLQWKDEILGAEQPNFIYLHYFDPHDPYYAREPWFDLDALEGPDAASASAFARLRAGAWDEMDSEMREDLLDYLPRMLGFEDMSEVPP
ncbi:MAG: sulfatase-like hydrolase/transferase [Planctomycetota bacterium]|nr:sulfatase-like hydrolase/transferase [Planctomycetota bacterium]